MNTNLERYLEKSKDTMEEFIDNPGIFTDLKEPNLDWLDYEIYDDIFWVRTIYMSNKNRKETIKVYEKIKDFAKSLGCNKIQFTTKRDGKSWERLFKGMKVIQWKIEVKI